ncbi:MAG: hypothetical protein AAGA28_05430 [Pseudomonadota bacterium]
MLRWLSVVFILAASVASAHHTTPICDTDAGKILCTPIPDGAKDGGKTKTEK